MDYNQWMGGVDLSDALVKKYLPTMKATKMWKKLLINLLLRMTGKYIQTKQMCKIVAGVESNLYRPDNSQIQ